MSNPITAFWKSGMQSQGARDEEMRLRVAETSIYSQKLVDGFEKPELSVMRCMQPDQRLNDRPMYGVAHADLKNTDGGTRSTYMSARYYEDAAIQRRDELLAKYKR